MKKGYMRFRCRPIPRGSNNFHLLLRDIEHISVSDINSLSNNFELEFIKALYYEWHGKMDLYIATLDKLTASNDFDIIRCINLAIGYEKIGEFAKCKALLESFKNKSISEELQLSLDFNYQVCIEKEGLEKSIDFTKFFKFKNINIGNKILANIALHMHLVVCDKTNSQFNYIDSLIDAIEFEKKNNYTTYLKIYYTFLKFLNQKLPTSKINHTLSLIDSIPLHNRAAILAIMLHLTDDMDVISLIQKKLNAIYEESKSKIVKSIISKNLF